MKMRRGVNLCGIEQNPTYSTTASTGDVSLGAAYKFKWTTSPNGLYKSAPNCFYVGVNIWSIESSFDDCVTLCATTPICDQFYWNGQTCNLAQKSAIPTIISPKDGKCGQVLKRLKPSTFNFKSGSNGLAMYAPKCGYSYLNRKDLQWQVSDEDDCGALCAVTPSCSYFDFSAIFCYMYSIADPSSSLTPSPISCTYHTSCGYVTKKGPFVPNWKSSLNGKIISASNCGFIGTDPADVDVQRKDVKTLGEADCASTCAATSTCTHYRWSQDQCRLMSIVSPVVYYSTTGSCGSVLKFKSGSNGLAMYTQNCGYTNDNRKTLPSQLSEEADCGAVCAQTLTCAYFAFANGNCNLYSKSNPSSTVVPLPYSTTSFSSCGYVTGQKTPAPAWKNVADNGPSNGQVMAAPNCSYIGAQSNQNTSLTEADCRMACISSSSCSHFRWTNGACLQMSLTNPVVTYYSVSGSCGSVISRQIYNFTSGSNGLAMYGQNCDYTNDNKKTLPSQLSDEADCGAVCAQISTCAFFAFLNGNCNLYTKADASSTVVPLPINTTSFSSCGYVTGQTTPAPAWKDVADNGPSNGQARAATNCGYIGEKSNQNTPLPEAYCRMACISSSSCSHFRWTNGLCWQMSLTNPVVYYSVSGSCGSVISRQTFTFTSGSNGLAMYSPKCGFTNDNRKTLSSKQSDESDCGAVCAQTSSCSYFAFSNGNCNLYTKTDESSPVVPLPINTPSFSSCGYVTGQTTPAPAWKDVAGKELVVTAPNCGYVAEKSIKTTSRTEAACRTACISSSSCSHFRWTNGVCLQMSLTNPVVTYYSVSGSCGYVVSRQKFNFISGSNGLAMYTQKCSYTSDNRKPLEGQLSDEVDCGAVCSVTPSCSYFVFADKCYMYAIADPSSSVVPTPQVDKTSYYSSCGYVTNESPFVPTWQSTSNGQIMSAQNCGYIGTDPVDIDIQSKNVKWVNEKNCASLCAATSTCTHYRWGSNGWCQLMAIVGPVEYYSVSGSCGYVVERKPITWETNGLFQTNSNCTFSVSNYAGYADINSIEACANICKNDTECTFFFLTSSGECWLISSSSPAFPIYSSDHSCGQIPSRITTTAD